MMNITIKDVRDEDVKYLGFMTVEEDDKYLHCSVEIFNNEVVFQDFMDGHIGKYQFQGNRIYTDYHEHCGSSFQGAGRGRKPEAAWEAMREFTKKVVNMDITLDEEHRVFSEYADEARYFYQVCE